MGSELVAPQSMPVAKLTDDIFMQMNEARCTLATYIDYRKAFDTVNHQILLHKLYYLGIAGMTYNWLADYLTNRYQCVVANGVASPDLHIVCGVPQGSILGPLLFLAYINDMPRVIQNCTVCLYADDAVLYADGRTFAEAGGLVQGDLDRMGKWSDDNQLTVNIKKTKCMVFGAHKTFDMRSLPDIRLKGQTLQFVDLFKYLGVLLDKKLTFRAHAENVYKLASHKVYLLSRIRPYINKKASMQIYKAKVLPFLDYGDIFYMSTFQGILGKLDKLQYRAIRICLKAPPRTSRVELTRQAEIPLLEFRRLVHLRNFAYGRSSDPRYIDHTIGRTRQHDAVCLMTFRAHYKSVERSVIWKGAREWNGLETGVRNIATKSHFKAVQKKWLLATLGQPIQ